MKHFASCASQWRTTCSASVIAFPNVILIQCPRQDVRNKNLIEFSIPASQEHVWNICTWMLILFSFAFSTRAQGLCSWPTPFFVLNLRYLPQNLCCLPQKYVAMSSSGTRSITWAALRPASIRLSSYCQAFRSGLLWHWDVSISWHFLTFLVFCRFLFWALVLVDQVSIVLPQDTVSVGRPVASSGTLSKVLFHPFF